jgi:hypothetical protein
MLSQIVWIGWSAALLQVFFRSDDRHGDWRRNTHRNHILFNLFTEANASIEPGRDDRANPVLSANLATMSAFAPVADTHTCRWTVLREKLVILVRVA